MIKIKFFLALLFLCSISSFAQESLNSYKYVIVPIQYGFQKSEDAYQVNSLTKFLFEKEGFIALLSNEEFPDELRKDRCLALTAKVNNNSKMLISKMNMNLVDCDNKVVFSTTDAKSKEKNYKTAYHEIIRKTFEDVKALNYKYTPKDDEITREISSALVDDSMRKSTTSNAVPVAVVATNNTIKEEQIEPVTTSTISVVEEKMVTPTPKLVVEKKAVTPVIAATVVTATVIEVEDVKVDDSALYAQAITNGYQLVDSTPKVVYIALKTSVEDVYLIKGAEGIIYKLNGIWVAEYYENDKLMRKSLNIKLL